MLSGTGGRAASSTQSRAGYGDDGCVDGDSSELMQQCVEETRIHLTSTWTALCRLLAFRVRFGKRTFRVRFERGAFWVRFERGAFLVRFGGWAFRVRFGGWAFRVRFGGWAFWVRFGGWALGVRFGGWAFW